MSALSNCSPKVLKVVPMAMQTSGDSTLGVSGLFFANSGLVYDSMICVSHSSRKWDWFLRDRRQPPS